MASMWNQGSRIAMLRLKVEKLGVELDWDNARFAEVLQRYISELPESQEKDAARRFYVEQDVQKKDVLTGRPTTEDYRFYQFLSSFRFAFSDYLRREYGNTTRQ